MFSPQKNRHIILRNHAHFQKNNAHFPQNQTRFPETMHILVCLVFACLENQARFLENQTRQKLSLVRSQKLVLGGAWGRPAALIAGAIDSAVTIAARRRARRGG